MYDDEKMRDNLEIVIKDFVFQDFIKVCSIDLSYGASEINKAATFLVVDIETNEVFFYREDEQFKGKRVIVLFEFPKPDNPYKEMVEGYQEFVEFKTTMLKRLDKKSLIKRSEMGKKKLRKLMSKADEEEDKEDDDNDDDEDDEDDEDSDKS